MRVSILVVLAAALGTCGAAQTINIGDNITLGGLFEAEAYTRWADDSHQDILLRRGELDLNIAVSEQLALDFALVWEEDVIEPIDLEQGYFTYTEPLWHLRGGRMIIPFGDFKTGLASYPLTRLLGRARETAILFYYDSGMVNIEGGPFNGTLGINENLDDMMSNFVLKGSVRPVEGLTLNLSYIRNIGDTDSLQSEFAATNLQRGVPAICLFIEYIYDRFTLTAEYITSGTNFDAGDLDSDYDGDGDRPSAYSLEVSVEVNERTRAALRLSGSHEFALNPQSYIAVGASYIIDKNVKVIFEAARFSWDSSYGFDDGSTIILKGVADF